MSSKALSDLDHGWGRFRAVDVTVGLRLPDREEPVKKETLLANVDDRGEYVTPEPTQAPEEEEKSRRKKMVKTRVEINKIEKKKMQ